MNALRDLDWRVGFELLISPNLVLHAIQILGNQIQPRRRCGPAENSAFGDLDLE